MESASATSRGLDDLLPASEGKGTVKIGTLFLPIYNGIIKWPKCGYNVDTWVQCRYCRYCFLATPNQNAICDSCDRKINLTNSVYYRPKPKNWAPGAIYPQGTHPQGTQTMPRYGSSSFSARGTSRIWWDPAVLAYRVVTPFSQQFVDALKALIPASDRVWDPDAKQWTIHEAYLDATAKFCEQVFGNKPTILDRAAAEKQAAAQPNGQSGAGSSFATTRGQPLDVTIVAFFRMLSYDAAKAAYRKSMMENHPDAVGADQNNSKAADLNAAWSRIEKELYGK